MLGGWGIFCAPFCAWFTLYYIGVLPGTVAPFFVSGGGGGVLGMELVPEAVEGGVDGGEVAAEGVGDFCAVVVEEGADESGLGDAGVEGEDFTGGVEEFFLQGVVLTGFGVGVEEEGEFVVDGHEC